MRQKRHNHYGGSFLAAAGLMEYPVPDPAFPEPSMPRRSGLPRKRRRQRILAIRYFPELETLECLVLPSVVTWSAVGSDGETPASGDWSNFSNWTDGRGLHRLPGPND